MGPRPTSPRCPPPPQDHTSSAQQPAHRVESCRDGSRSPREAARSCRGAPEAPRRQEQGPSARGGGGPGLLPRDQRGRAAGVRTVAPGLPLRVWVPPLYGRVNITEASKSWRPGLGTAGRPAGPALPFRRAAVPWSGGGGSRRAGLLPGQLGGRGPQSLRDRGSRNPRRGYETREGKNHEGATCGRAEKRSAPQPSTARCPHQLWATSSPVCPVI